MKGAQASSLIVDSSLRTLAEGAGGSATGWKIDIKGLRRGDPAPVTALDDRILLRWDPAAERVRLMQPLLSERLNAEELQNLTLTIDLVARPETAEQPLLWAAILRRSNGRWEFEQRFRLQGEKAGACDRFYAIRDAVLLDPAGELALALQFKPEAREVGIVSVELTAEPVRRALLPVALPVPAPSLSPGPTAVSESGAEAPRAIRTATRERIKLRTFHGKVDRASGDLVKGWIAPIDPADMTVPTLSLYLDGIRYGTVPTHERADLVHNGVPNGVGFRYETIISPKPGLATATLVVDKTGERICSPFDVPETRMPPRPAAAALSAAGLAAAAGRGISIVIPIFNAADALETCLKRVVAHTTGAARLILIDDASTDPHIARLLATYASIPNVTILRNPVNLGFTRTVNRGLEHAAGDDIVFLNSDTRVTPRWLQNLRLAAYSGHDVASATPLSDNAGIFSFDVADLEKRGWSDDAIARLVSQASGQLRPTTPTAHGFCAYFRGDMLREIGILDAEAFPRGYGEENDLSMRAGYAGWSHVVDDRTIIFHDRAKSFGDQREGLLAEGRTVMDGRYPEYTARARALSRDRRLALAKFQLRNAMAAAAKLPPARPRVLYVIASRTGGTPQTNRDLMLAIGPEVDAFLLHSDSNTISLWRMVDGEEVACEERTLQQTIDVRSHRSREYDLTVSEWLDDYQIELVHIRHMGWHSLGLIDAAHLLQIPVLFSMHDYYVSCPTIKLLDNELRYCAGRCTPGDGLCQPELWPKPTVPHLKHAWVHNWRKLLLPALAKCDGFITTLGSARDVIRDSYPELAAMPFDVIPHGRDFDEYRAALLDLGAREPFRILLAGNIGPQKGGDIVADLAQRLADPSIEIHVAGRVSGRLLDAPVAFHGPYERDDFGRVVAGIRPAVGAILSIWPETYCHTLTELWAAGLPVIGFDIGAVGERIRETGAGWVLPIGDGAELLEAVKAIAADRADQARKREAVRKWQTAAARKSGTREMGLAYLKVYDRVLAGRRAFQGASTASPGSISQTRPQAA
jgi:GT2 family glycosyltransferase/glycosyltransferase involved in cell wall biosynthesis